MQILKKFETDAWFRKKIVIFPLILIILVALLEIWAVNRLSTFGVQISELERNAENLRLENQLLENEIAQKSSLNEQQKDSQKLGYVRVRNIEFIKELNLASAR